MKFILGFLAIVLFATQAQAEKIKIGSSNASSSAGIFIAQEKNYFKEEGLDTELILMKASSIPMTTLMANGELDIAAGVINAGLYNALAKGILLKMVADKGHLEKTRDYIGLVVRSDLMSEGKYKNLTDLKGKKIGLISNDGASQQIVLDRMLKKVGLTMKDVETVKLAYPEINSAMKSKSIDAAIQIEPYLTLGLKEKLYERVAGASTVADGQISAAIFYGKKILEDKGDLGIRWMRAYLRGVKDYNEAFSSKKKNQEEIIRILVKYTDAQDPELWKKMQPAGLYNDGKIRVQSIESDLNWYKENGYLKGELSLEKIIDNSYAEKALKKRK